MSTAAEHQPTTENSDLPSIAERSHLLHAMSLMKNNNGRPTAAQSGGRSHSPNSLGIGFVTIVKAETRKMFKIVTSMIFTMIVVLDAKTFALTADSGAIVLYTHSGGRNLKTIANVDTAHTAHVLDICVLGDL